MAFSTTSLRVGLAAASGHTVLPLSPRLNGASPRLLRHGGPQPAAASASISLTSQSSSATLLAPAPVAAETVLSRYALGAPLGQGAMGTVVSACDRVTGEEVAIKVVAKQWNAGRHQRSALHKEASLWRRACAASRQAGRFIAIEEDPSNYYIISEKCHGGSLQHMLESRGVLTEAELSQVAWCVLTFLSDMHSHSIYYGDLKPSNVILKDVYPCNSDPGCLNVRVVDFGCSQLVTHGSPLRSLSGSPLFLAPEVITGAYGLPADMWAFGAMLFMLICNRLPFWLEPIPHLEEMEMDSICDAIRYHPVLFSGPLWRGVSEELKELICGLLEKDPARRLTASQAMEHPWFANAKDMCALA